MSTAEAHLALARSITRRVVVQLELGAGQRRAARAGLVASGRRHRLWTSTTHAHTSTYITNNICPLTHHSLMPYSSIIGMYNAPKNSSVSSEIGAAPVKHILHLGTTSVSRRSPVNLPHRSRPSARRTLLSTSFCATANANGSSQSPLADSAAYLGSKIRTARAHARQQQTHASAPRALAHATSCFLRPVVPAPICFIFSMIFSQTRGTPKKIVGLKQTHQKSTTHTSTNMYATHRQAFSVSPSVPLSASGRAKCTVALPARVRSFVRSSPRFVIAH